MAYKATGSGKSLINYNGTIDTIADWANVPNGSVVKNLENGEILVKGADGSKSSPLTPDGLPSSATTIQVNDVLPKTAYPSGTVNTGHKVALTGTGSLHMTYGTIIGLAKNDIIEKTASDWIISKAAVDIPNNSLLRNARNGKQYFLDKSAGVDTYKPVGSGDKFKMITVEPNKGVDDLYHGDRITPVRTLDYAVTQIDGSGCRIELMPGTHGVGEAQTLSGLNVVYQGVGSGNGNVNVNKQLTLANASSNQHLVGLNLPLGLVSNSAGSNFVKNCTFGTGATIAKSGAGYFEMTDSDCSTSILSIAGAGRVMVEGGFVGYLTINNAAAQVALRNVGSVVQPNLITGVLFIDGATIYAPTANDFALNTDANTFVFLFNCKFAKPDNTQAKINIQGYHSMVGCTYLETGSTINKANNLNYKVVFDALKTFGLIEAEGGVSMDWSQTAANGYKQKAWVSRFDTTDNQWYFYRAKADIAYNTAWNASLWDRVGGSGGGGSSFFNKRNVDAFINTSKQPIYQEDGKEYILTNVLNLDSTFFQFSDLTTPNEGDVYQFSSATGKYSRTLDVSTLTQSGEYEVDVTLEKEKYYYRTGTGWQKIITEIYDTAIAKGRVQKHAAFNFVTPDNGDERTIEQVKAATAELFGYFGSITENNFNSVDIVNDDSRLLYIRRYGDNNNEYGFYHFQSDGFNVVPQSPFYKIGGGGDTLVGQTFVVQGANYLAHLLLQNQSLNIFIQEWDVTTSTYVQLGVYTLQETAILNFKSTINANGIIEILYTTSVGLYRQSAIVQNEILTTNAAELISETVPFYYGVFGSGGGGRYIYIYSTDGITFNYVTYNTNTSLNRSIVTELTQVELASSISPDDFRGVGKLGQIILNWKNNSGSFAKIIDAVTGDNFGTTKISDNQIDVVFSYGDATDMGQALGKFSEDNRPRICGWTIIDNVIVLAEPSIIIGTRTTIDINYGLNSIWDGSRFVNVYAGINPNGVGIIPPTHMEIALSTITANPSVVHDGIIQEDGINGQKVRIARNGQISTGHTGIVVGQTYYISGGKITTDNTGIEAGIGISNTEIELFTDFNNNNGRIDTLETNITALQATNVAQNVIVENLTVRVTALEEIEEPIDITEGGSTMFVTTNKGRLFAIIAESGNVWPYPGTGLLGGASYDYNTAALDQLVGIENARQVIFVNTNGTRDDSAVQEVYHMGYTVAVRLANGNLWGWGQEIGMLSNGTPGVNSLTPVLLTTNVDKIWKNKAPIDVSNQRRALFVQKNDGKTYGVGSNYYGWFGDTTGINVDTGRNWAEITWIGANPRGVYPMGNFYQNILVEKSDGTILVCGIDTNGCLGTGTTTTKTTPVDVTVAVKGVGNEVSNSIVDVFAGRGWIDASVNTPCWTILNLAFGESKYIKAAGYNNYGILAQNNTTNTTFGWFKPSIIANSAGDIIDFVAGGGGAGCAFGIKNKQANSEPELVAWGYNGQKNYDDTTSSSSVIKVITPYLSTKYPTKILNSVYGNFMVNAHYSDNIIVEFFENGEYQYYIKGVFSYGERGNGLLQEAGWSRILFPKDTRINLTGRFFSNMQAGSSVRYTHLAYDYINKRFFAWGNATNLNIDGKRAFKCSAPHIVKIKELNL